MKKANILFEKKPFVLRYVNINIAICEALFIEIFF